MMFRHQRIGSRQHGRDCRLPRASRVSRALLALACALLICGLAGAVDYGEINVTPANCDQWSTNLSNNESNVAGDIIVNDGAVLSIENATVKIKYSSGYRSIIVKNDGTLNINGSTITRGDSNYYGWRYESGSRGNVTNSTVEFCIYNNSFKIETNETVSLFNVTFDHGDVAYSSDCYATYLNSASNASIRECTIKTSSGQTYSNRRYTYGIRIQSSRQNTLENIVIEDKSSYHHGIYIQSSDNNTLENIGITRELYSSVDHDAVHIESSFGNTLRNFTITGSDNLHGIYASASNNTSIVNSTIDGTGNHGVYIRNSILCNLTENRIADSGDDGIFVQNSDNTTLLANNMTRNRDGIRLDASPNSSLTENTVADSSELGINITSSGNCTLLSNSITNCTEHYHLYVVGDYDQDIDTSNTVNGGKVYYNYSDSETTITDTNIGHVTIVDCSDLWFTGCTVHNGDGIRIRGDSSNVSIRDSTIENNTVYGVNFESSSLNNITAVTIENNTKQGVYLVGSSNNTINDSHILNNIDKGIHTIGTSSNNSILNNSILNNSGGIHLDGSGYNNITDNNVSENTGNGIQLGGGYGDHLSKYNILHNNTVRSNNGTGIVFNTNYNRVTENTISDNTNLALYFADPYYNNSIWRNNTANGEEVNYYYNEHDLIIESKYLSAYNVSNVGKITLIDCTNIIVRDSELSNNNKSGYGIFLWNSNNNNLTNNTISNNYYGILLHGSSSNNITDLDTISPSDQQGAYFKTNSDYNNITDSSFASTGSHGMSIISSSHTTITNTTISSSSVDQAGAYVGGSYTTLTNVTITSSEVDGMRIGGDHTTIAESRIAASNTGVQCTSANHTDIINTTITADANGINMSQSHWGNLTNNTLDAASMGIFLTTSRDHNLTANNITNYTLIGILLEEYSTNNTMIGNDLTRNGSEFDIRLNDSNDCVIANNESVTANYTFYLTNDTRLATLDTVFDKTKVGYGDNESNLTLMWRIDALCWDNYHKEALTANLTVQYSDLSDANGSLCWDDEISAGADEYPGEQGGRLSGNLFGYWGPPTSRDNWLPIIEYKQNVSGKTTYQPMNCTAINRWDVLQDKNTTKSYRNVTTRITEPGVTICVDTGYTPNSKCYYCHEDKLTFANTKHWTKYETNVTNMSAPYTPGRCIDCHDKNDSEGIPHGNVSGKDLLYSQSPQLCYTGRTDETACHSVDATDLLDQEREFNQTTHHPLGDGQLACKACHDNHGTDHESDLLKVYATNTSGGYKSDYYALCLVCHLEEKLVAMMSGETEYLTNYSNQTNFRSEYWYGSGFNTVRLKNIHSPQGYQGSTHTKYNCYACHNPHGSDNPATTRHRAKKSKTTYYDILNFTYITNLTPPNETYPGDYLNQTILDQGNWSNSTMNQGGGLYIPLIPPNSDGCVCHGGPNGYGNLESRFTYREYTPYEPAGGAGCLECHDNNASAYNTTPIRPIVNLTAIKLAMHTNLSGAFRNGSILQGTSRNFTGWLTDRNYTAEQMNNITEDNAICWACHSTNGTPPSPGFHPDRTMTPYKCPKCHGPYDGQPPHTQGLVAAIDNHGPTTKGAESILIQTDVGNGGSCGDCHAPSVLSNDSIDNSTNPDDNLEVWKYTKKNNKHWRPYDGRTIMGDVSHYGLNKSQGEDLEIDNPLCDTTDCLFCHCNWTNGQIWGNATNISGNMYGADTNDISTCYTYCHVRPDWAGNVNNSTLSHFHNESIYAGGGPNCTLCHDIGSEYGVQSLVNATAIAEGIHGNMLNNTLVHDGYGMDNRSNPCWGCHNSDGTIPEGMGDRNGITDLNEDGRITADELPYTCEDCHARSDAWDDATDHGEAWESASDPALGMNRLPPEILDHYPNSTLVKTNDHSDNGRCVDCHNNSIDLDANDTKYKELGHTIFSGVSHYGTYDDLLAPTRVCRYCHNDTVNASIWGGATQNQHGNFTDEANPEDGCYYCHANDETPEDFHLLNAESIPGDPDCLRCHGNNGTARRRIDENAYVAAMNHSLMNNATAGQNGTNQSCWVCHFPEGKGVDKHSNRLEPAYHCYDCHNKLGGPFSNVSDAPDVYNHFKNGTNISAYWTRPTDSDSCMGCHNQSGLLHQYSENDTYRTDFSITSHYGDNRTDLVAMCENNDNNTEYCSYCHVNDTPFMPFENIIVNITHAGDANCEDCHGTGRLHGDNATRVTTTGNCTDCHALYGSNRTHYMGNGTIKYEINVTAMNLGVHADVNENLTSVAAAPPINDSNNSKCWGCHVPDGANPLYGHRDTFNNDAYLCYECHNGTYAYQNVSSATAVYNHFKSGYPIRARTIATTNSSSCGFGCHNLSTMKVPGFDAGGNATYRLNMSQASHYPRNRTDIANESDLSDCTWCHRNSTNEFIEIYERAGSPNYTENIPHATETSSCIIPDCHDRGRIHDRNLTIPAWDWYDRCDDCHFGLNAYSNVTKYYVNETMFNDSVHADVNCTKCHIYTTANDRRHPIEEYTWKWCECCHSYQLDPINESDRHNVTADPANYSINISKTMTPALDITDCTTCHNATAYETAKANFNSSTERDCLYCHSYPDL